MQKKCYIAGQIGGLFEEAYTENFRQAEQEVVMMGYAPVSPLNLPHNHNRSWKAYMIEDLTEMLKCDVVYAQRNIRFSPGGMIEIETAMKVGIDVIHQK